MICVKCLQQKEKQDILSRPKDPKMAGWCRQCAAAYFAERDDECQAMYNMCYPEYCKQNKVTKVCTLCGIEKPKTEFNKDSKGKNGLSSRCKLCTRASDKEYKARLVKDNGMNYYQLQKRRGSAEEKCPACFNATLIRHPRGFQICGECKWDNENG